MTAGNLRFDIYLSIHKGLRTFMCETLCNVGRLDFEDDAAVQPGLAQLRVLLAFCRGHVAHENDFVHPAMEARAPGSAKTIGHEHEEHLQTITALEQDIAAVEATTGAARAASGLRLYHRLSEFVAENLIHMLVEEREHNAVLWRCYSDAEIAAIHHNLVASLSPEENMLALRLMMPNVAPRERLAILRDIQAGAPAEVFAGILGATNAMLADADRRKLAAGLSMPAAA